MPDDRPDAPGNAPPDATGAVRDVVILCLLAALLRGWAFGRLGLSHYDEGGYAMSAQALARGDYGAMYPLQHFLSPPFLFGFTGVLARLFALAAERVLLVVSAGFGVLTVALVYAAARYWFGRAAGAAAALVIALSDFHILLSRVGLTDVAFGAWFVLAILLYSMAETRRSYALAALAGLATGLAWNTKYHGWLAGVIAAAAVVPGLLRGPRSEARGTLLRLATAAAVAIAVYLPWFLYVQSQEGGYARLAQEHARYLRPTRFARAGLFQLRQQLALDGWPSRLAPALALLCCAWITRARLAGLLPWVAALLVAGIAFGASVTLGLLAVAGAVRLLLLHGRSGGRHWYPLAFFVVFTVLSPLYRPYARLLLPWVLAAAILGSATLAAIATREARALELGAPRRLLLPACLALAALLVMVLQGVRPGAATWRPTDGFRGAAPAVDSLASGNLPIGVLGEPAMVVYLRQRGRTAWALNSMTDFGEYLQNGQEAYLVGGVYSRRARGRTTVAAWLEAHPTELLAEVPVTRLNTVRLFDDFNPEQTHAFLSAPTDDYRLRIYRITWHSP